MNDPESGLAGLGQIVYELKCLGDLVLFWKQLKVNKGRIGGSVGIWGISEIELVALGEQLAVWERGGLLEYDSTISNLGKWTDRAIFTSQSFSYVW